MRVSECANNIQSIQRIPPLDGGSIFPVICAKAQPLPVAILLLEMMIKGKKESQPHRAQISISLLLYQDVVDKQYCVVPLP